MYYLVADASSSWVLGVKKIIERPPPPFPILALPLMLRRRDGHSFLRAVPKYSGAYHLGLFPATVKMPGGDCVYCAVHL